MSRTYEQAYGDIVNPALSVWGEFCREALTDSDTVRPMIKALVADIASLSVYEMCENAWRRDRVIQNPIIDDLFHDDLGKIKVAAHVQHLGAGVVPRFIEPGGVRQALEILPPDQYGMSLLVNHVRGRAARVGNKVFERRGNLFVQVSLPASSENLQEINFLQRVMQRLTDMYQGQFPTNGVWFRNVIMREQALAPTLSQGLAFQLFVDFEYEQVVDFVEQPVIEIPLVPSLPIPPSGEDFVGLAGISLDNVIEESEPWLISRIISGLFLIILLMTCGGCSCSLKKDLLYPPCFTNLPPQPSILLTCIWTTV